MSYPGFQIVCGMLRIWLQIRSFWFYFSLYRIHQEEGESEWNPLVFLTNSQSVTCLEDNLKAVDYKKEQVGEQCVIHDADVLPNSSEGFSAQILLLADKATIWASLHSV